MLARSFVAVSLLLAAVACTRTRATSSAAPPSPELRECIARAPAKSSSGPFGTDHPGVPYAASRAGGWAVICEARQDSNGDGKIWLGYGHHGDLIGDDLVAYLSIHDGPGIGIDDWVTHDPSGRFVVVVQFGKLLLFDTTLGTRTRLDTTAVDPNPHSRAHRAAAFSPDGRLLLLHRQGKLIVRDVYHCAEREIDVGPGAIGYAAFEISGTAILAEVATSDTNGDGVVSAFGRSSATPYAGPRWCVGGMQEFYERARTGDLPPRFADVTTMLRIPLDGGPIKVVPSDGARIFYPANDAELVEPQPAGAGFLEAGIGPFSFRSEAP